MKNQKPMFNFFEIYTELEDRVQSIAKLREQIVSQIDPVIANLKLGMRLSSYDDIRIGKRILEKEAFHFLAGVEVFEIWETNSDNEWARQIIIPTFVLTDKNYVLTYNQLQETWKQNQKVKATQEKENRQKSKEAYEIKEYKRLSRKFGKK